MKRFWREARTDESESGFRVLLDGKPLHLPDGAVLTLASPRLAQAIAVEWQEAGGEVEGEMTFADTPLTQLAGTAQERILPDPGPTAEAIARYAETDLLCYRAEDPEVLAQRQARAWQPWLDWAARAYDAPPLAVTSGVIAIRRNERAVAALRREVLAMDAWRLAGLGVATPALGSLVLGLALAEGALSASEAHELSLLDELFQAELWGHDAEADERRRKVGEDIAIAARFMELCRQ